MEDARPHARSGALIDTEGLRVLYLPDALTDAWIARAGARNAFLSLVLPPPAAGADLLLSDLVARLRPRLAAPPLVVLLVPLAARPDWPSARLLALSRRVCAPVIRAADGEEILDADLAGVIAEPLVTHGLTAIASDLVIPMFDPPSAGCVFRWNPVLADHKGVSWPAELDAALREPCVRGVLATYRANERSSLHSIEIVHDRIASAVRDSVPVELGSPCAEGRPEEVIVTVIVSEPRA